MSPFALPRAFAGWGWGYASEIFCGQTDEASRGDGLPAKSYPDYADAQNPNEAVGMMIVSMHIAELMHAECVRRFPDLQAQIFRTLGIPPAEIEERFGHLIRAFGYGAPPHGGIAFGLDRLAMLMSGAESIRDVIAFPKTQSAWCPLTDAPSEADDAALAELHIRVRKPPQPAG